MFDMFAERARRVVLLAQEESRLLRHRHIGTEHLLLGLLAQGDGMAAEVLESLSMTLDAARQQVAEVVAPGKEDPTGSIPFTERTKNVIEFSQVEARSLGHSELDTAHMLLGLVRESEGVGAQVCVKLGVDLDQVRLRALQLLMPGGLDLSASGQSGSGSLSDVAVIRTQLTAIQDDLRDLSKRLAAIERHFNIG